jgi:hypothetical protein
MDEMVKGSTHSKETKLRMSLSRKGSKLSEETKRKIGYHSRGRKRTELECQHMREGIKKKRIPKQIELSLFYVPKKREWTDEQREEASLLRTGTTLSEETKKKIGNSVRGINRGIEWRKKLSLAHKGENSHCWKGGVSPINKRIRHSVEYKLWRESVFERDDWTCQVCMKRGGTLHPHHIKPFAEYPELRFAIDNGETLCVDCHTVEHSDVGFFKRRGPKVVQMIREGR